MVGSRAKPLPCHMYVCIRHHDPCSSTADRIEMEMEMEMPIAAVQYFHRSTVLLLHCTWTCITNPIPAFSFLFFGAASTIRNARPLL